MELWWHRGVCPRAEISLLANVGELHEAEMYFWIGETTLHRHTASQLPARSGRPGGR
jgi:hypothetical protein